MPGGFHDDDQALSSVLLQKLYTAFKEHIGVPLPSFTRAMFRCVEAISCRNVRELEMNFPVEAVKHLYAMPFTEPAIREAILNNINKVASRIDIARERKEQVFHAATAVTVADSRVMVAVLLVTVYQRPVAAQPFVKGMMSLVAWKIG